MDQRNDWLWQGLGALKVAALVAGGLATVTGCSADGGDTSEPASSTSEAVVSVSQVTWTQGVSSALGVHTHVTVDQGFCFLSKIGGSFRGNGESVYLDNSEGEWVLGGTSQQSGVTATASCIQFAALKHTDLFSTVYLSRSGTNWLGASSGPYGGPGQFCFMTGFRGETNGTGEGAAVVPVAGGWQLQVSHHSGSGIQAQLACIARISGDISLAENTNFSCSGSTCVFPIVEAQPHFCVLNSLFGRMRGGGEFALVQPNSPGNLLPSFVTLQSQQGGILTSASCAYL